MTEEPPSDDAVVQLPAARVLTQRHKGLLAAPPPSDAGWADVAVYACVEHLALSSVTETWTVAVIDAWADSDTSLCVVYTYPYFDGVLGIRRAMYSPEVVDGYDMGDAGIPDPKAFGMNVAAWDIGEPMGSTGDKLKPDAEGIHWWGDQHDD